MKKKVIVVVVFVLVVLLGFGIYYIFSKDKVHKNATEVLERTSVNNEQNEYGSTLVVYFSRGGENYRVGNVEVGNTAVMASYIVDYLDADSYELIPVNKYSEDYDIVREVAHEELINNERPEIEIEVSIDGYDTIFLGYPIWWGDMPMIVYTFLENNDFTDKTIIPFNTHEGSGSAGTYTTIKNMLDSSTVYTNGLALTGRVARTENGKEETIDWLTNLGF